jgi:1-hydroxy-2-isopentenylcarotenoid 3,4-desaturase
MIKKLPETAVVVGAGIGGLATAILLARSGVKVTVCEKLDKPGGRMGWIEADGFAFDTGPSWFLMPDVFEHFFASIGENMHELLDLRRLDPGYKVFFESGLGPLAIHGDQNKDAQTFATIEPGADKQLQRYLVQAEKTYKAATNSFLYTNFDNYAAFLKPRVLASVPRIGFAALQSIDNYVSRFISTPELKQLLEYHMVFLGMSPYNAPSLFRLMGYMDFCQGVFYPQGGMYKIIEVMLKLADKYGVTVHTNTAVEQIVMDGGMATGVRLEGGEIIMADTVVSNTDVYNTETKLLALEARSYSDRYFTKLTPSPSALLMYLGVKGKLPQLTHHNLFFTTDWRKNFDEIIEQKIWPNPASMYVCKPSETDPDVAPRGCENVFVLVPVPAGINNMDDAELSKHADIYLQQISNYAKIPDLKERIVYKKLFGPNDFVKTYNSWEGSMLGPAHTLKQSALWRTPNKSKKVKNLYYVGATTSPGIGMPMCLISAELVYKRLTGDTSITALPTPIEAAQ